MASFLQSNYKWWYVFIYFIKRRTTYRIDNLLFALGQCLVVLGPILIWYLAIGQINLDFKDKLTYLLVGNLFLCFIYQWPSFFGFEISSGAHTRILITPVNFFKFIFFRFYGYAILQNLTQLLIIISSIFFLHSWILPPSSVLNLILVGLLALISVFILFFLELLVGLLAFFLTEINGVILNYGYINNLLSGRLFPLGLLIPYFWANALNPFSYLFYHPMQIYLGKYSSNQIFAVFGCGLLWIFILYIIAKMVFKLGLKKNESVGL